VRTLGDWDGYWGLPSAAPRVPDGAAAAAGAQTPPRSSGLPATHMLVTDADEDRVELAAGGAVIYTRLIIFHQGLSIQHVIRGT
jgi:hypothetical protein